MKSKEELLDDFNRLIGERIEEYALLGVDGNYSIINVPKGLIFVMEDYQLFSYCVDRLLMLNVPVYSTADIPVGLKRRRSQLLPKSWMNC